MKVTIPEDLKAEIPQTIWGRILSATPIVMAVVATALAGLSSSEMTRAQYSRSSAAQLQSKAGDQWSFFQAKRLRSALQRNTLDLLQATTEVRPLEVTARDATALAFLQKGELPDWPAAPAIDPKLKSVLDAIEAQRPEPEIAVLLADVSNQTVEESLRVAKDRVQTFDGVLRPVHQTMEELEKRLAGADRSLYRDFTAARLRFASLRYDAEARLNQAIAGLYEVEVRKSNLDADRHHRRSQRFFYGMLAAQAAVIIATFAVAARKRNLLWSLAAAAGTAAVGFAVYVYLFV